MERECIELGSFVKKNVELENCHQIISLTSSESILSSVLSERMSN